MAEETDVDQRGYRLALVSARLLRPHSPQDRALTLSILGWADEHGYGVYQLPRVPTGAHGGRLSASAEQDILAGLDFVVTQLSTYSAAGYSVAGAVLSGQDIKSAAGQGWLRHLVERTALAGASPRQWWLVPDRAHRFDPQRHLRDVPAALDRRPAEHHPAESSLESIATAS